MYYISIQDSTDTDKWCFLTKYHTWDRACGELRDLLVAHGKPCKIEWSEHPPLYSHVQSVY